MVLALLFNDVWRASFSLIAQVNGTPGRGALLPMALLPASLFVLSIAWAFLLTGALHAHPLARVGILVFYVLVMGIRVLALVSTEITSGDLGSLPMWLCVFALLAVPVFFILRRRSQAHPIVDFTLLLIFVSVIYIVSQSTGVASWRAFGIPVTLAEIEADIQLPGLVIMPLLLFFGVDVANFTRRAAGWAVDIVTLRMARWALWIILAGVFVLRWYTLAQETTERLSAAPLATALPGYLGALGTPVIVGLVWLSQRINRSERINESGVSPKEVDRAVEHVVLPLIVVYYVTSLVASLILGQTALDVGGVLISIGALVAAALFFRRGQRHYALYLAVFGALSIWRELTKPGAPLGMLGVSAGQATGNAPLVDFWWMTALTLIGLYWLARRRCRKSCSQRRE